MTTAIRLSFNSKTSKVLSLFMKEENDKFKLIYLFKFELINQD